MCEVPCGQPESPIHSSYFLIYHILQVLEMQASVESESLSLRDGAYLDLKRGIAPIQFIIASLLL
jgi:hypothetical protein